VLTRALVLLSGGIDSAVALWWARDRYAVTALSFDGARRPRGEVRACRAIARRARVPYVRVDLPFLEPQADGYVPGRNLVYHSAAISIAERRGAKAVVAGHNRSDAKWFADARPGFFRRLLTLADGVKIVRPFAAMTDAQVVRLGAKLGAPLDLTWSCYRDGAAPCRRCPACRDRRAILS
jgi:7-cyano-7-deazaguanine synthase